MSKSFLSYFIVVLLFLSTISPVHNTLSCSTGCNHGNCITGNKCACQLGYFDSIAPCDTEVPALYNQQYTQKIIPAKSWVYFFVSLHDIINDVQLQFQAVEGTATAYILLQSHDSYNLPTENDASLLITPTTNADNTISYQITSSKIQATKGGWLTVAFYNNGPLQARVRVQYVATINQNVGSDVTFDSDNGAGSSDKLVKTVIVIPILVVGVILFVGFYIKSKAERLRNRHRNRVHQQVTPREHPRRSYEFVIPMDLTPPQTPQNQSSSQQTQKPNQLLGQEIIQYYFPKKSFSQLKTPFPHTTCSICLDDFKAESECHQLYCFHIFHEKCIGEWLAKHDSCPDCRKPMTREAIKKIIKAERQRIQQEQSALLSGRSPNQSPTAQRHQRLQSLHIAH